jgi:hypothetical protein
MESLVDTKTSSDDTKLRSDASDIDLVSMVTIKHEELPLTAPTEIVTLYSKHYDDVFEYINTFDRSLIDAKYTEISPLIINDRIVGESLIGYDYSINGQEKLAIRLNKPVDILYQDYHMPLEFARNVGAPTPIIYRRDITPGTYTEVRDNYRKTITYATLHSIVREKRSFPPATLTKGQYKTGVVADGLFYAIDTASLVVIYGQYKRGIVSWVIIADRGNFWFILYDNLGYISKLRYEGVNQSGTKYSFRGPQYNGQFAFTIDSEPSEVLNINKGVLVGPFSVRTNTVDNRNIKNTRVGLLTGDRDIFNMVGTLEATPIPKDITPDLLFTGRLYQDSIRGYVQIYASEATVLGHPQKLFKEYFINDNGNKDGQEIIHVGLADIVVNDLNNVPITNLSCDILAEDKIYCRYNDNKEVTSIVRYWIDGEAVTQEVYTKYHQTVKDSVNLGINNVKIPVADIVNQYLQYTK